ncbi:carbohydrate ABC transporter permease [Candidatus Bipolaricaulota bacterium]
MKALDWIRNPRMPEPWRDPNYWKETGWAYVYLAPSLIILGLFVFYPFFSAFGLSMFKWSSVRPPGTYIGLANYRYIFNDKYFWRAMANTFIYVGISVPATLFVALLAASLLNKPLRFLSGARMSYFLAYITPIVAVSMVWRWMYNWQYGLLNHILGYFGIDLVNWLGDPKWAMPALIIFSIWRYVGYEAIILLAGLQGIDKMYYDAAKVDGASGFQVWRKVTVPLLTPQIFFVFVISLIGSFKVFTEVFILFGGSSGPLRAAETLVYYIMSEGPLGGRWHMGRAAAASVVLFGIIFAFTLFQMTITQKRVHYQ